MRWTLLLLLLVGCGVSRESRLADAEKLVANGADVTPVSETGGIEPGTVAIDYTLIDLDADAAQRLLALDAPSEIAPRKFKQPMGELIAVAVLENDVGAVLDAGRRSLRDGEPMQIDMVRRVPYLLDWRDPMQHPPAPTEEGAWRVISGPTPVLDAIDEGVTGTLHVAKSDGGWSVNADTNSSHLLLPMARFTTTLGPDGIVFIHVPSLVKVHRAAAETVQPGETVMFQLSRVGNRDAARVRLLFVRIVTPES